MSADPTIRQSPIGPRRGVPSALLSLVVAGVLVTALAGKLMDWRGFLDAVRAIEAVPSALVLPSAALVIAAECIVAGLLLHPKCRRTGGLAGAALFAGFLLLNGALAVGGAEADCACFGVLLRLSRGASLTLDAFLIAACATLFGRRPKVQAAAVAAPAGAAQPSLGDPVEEPRPASPLPLLCFLLAVAACGFAALLPRDPVLFAWLTSPIRALAASRDRKAAEERLTGLRSMDPPVGALLPVPRGSVEGGTAADGADWAAASRLAPGPRVLVVLFFGTCSGCVLPVLRDAEDLMDAQRDVRVIGVSLSPPLELRAARRRYKLRVGLISDAKGRLAGRYNVAWRPRAYVLAPSGKLLWCQERVRPEWGAIARVVRRGGGS